MNNYKIYMYISPSNKVYIGQTCNTLKRRAGNGSNYKGCTFFYQAILKYGFENFTSQILKDNLSLEEANYWEKYYIQYYDSTNREKGYNISIGGKAMSEEQKALFSKRMIENNPMKNPEIAQKVRLKIKGKKFSEEARKNISEGHKKKVLCIETGIIYPSRNEAAQAVGVSPSGIGRAINGEQKTSAGYHWRYIDESKEFN